MLLPKKSYRQYTADKQECIASTEYMWHCWRKRSMTCTVLIGHLILNVVELDTYVLRRLVTRPARGNPRLVVMFWFWGHALLLKAYSWNDWLILFYFAFVRMVIFLFKIYPYYSFDRCSMLANNVYMTNMTKILIGRNRYHMG